MSSRAMKKLLRDTNGPAPLKDLEHTSATTKDPRALKEYHKDHEDQEERNDEYGDEGEENEEDDYVPRQPARNLFALLDEDAQEDVAESDNNDKESESIAPATTSSSKKKKNKKKKSGTSSATGAVNPFEALKDDNTNDDSSIIHAAATPPKATEREDDVEVSTTLRSRKKNKKKGNGRTVSRTLEEMSVEEFERSLQQANRQLGSLSTAEGMSQTPTVTPLRQLLAVDTRFLDADAEMKKMFGARVVNSEIRDRRYAKIVKKALLAQPRNTWQVRRASGLSMEVVATDENENITTFKIVHSEYYQRTQLKFLAAVASYDPNNLVAVLRESPFHVDSLLQLSEVSKHNGDVALAGEFIEQALYAFERSFHSLFNIASGLVRLNYMEIENRSFFLALHRHIQFLGRRGCWRTAFEFNKLLLSLDPQNDPLGALLSIDFYALKAQEHNYLKRLYERLKQDHGLDQMPNFLYSIALAQFHLESAQGHINNNNSNSNSSSSSGGSKHKESSKLLQKAILMFPTAVPLLADQGNFNVDGEVAGEAAFYPATDLPVVLDLHVHMFVLRNFALWKEPEVISWLKSNIRICVQSRFKDNNDPDVKEAKALLTRLTSKYNNVKEEPVLSYGSDGTLESDTYTSQSLSSSKMDSWSISLRVCRHVLISEYTSLTRYLPEEIVTATMHMHDPLPPPGSRNVYEERFEEQRRSSFGGLMGGTRDAAQNMLEEVVRRLRAGGLLRFGGGGGGAEGAGGVGDEGGAEPEANGLRDPELRRIAEAVQLLRTRHRAHGRGDALPGAFPGLQQQQTTDGTTTEGPATITTGAEANGSRNPEVAGAIQILQTRQQQRLADGAATEGSTITTGAEEQREIGSNAETQEALIAAVSQNVALTQEQVDEDPMAEVLAQQASLSQSLREMIRVLGFGARTGDGDGAEAATETGTEDGNADAMTEEEANELMAAIMNDFSNEREHDFYEEDITDNDQPFGSDGDDGWEPYDPAAFE
ncbi:Transcription factor 25 [Modicella reniformis]|uniref:Transcription factor 25 n=1 Tax=Modicella reniformis TaxID=1440133 RepID=A0A9P6M9L2_9FUNG|nr:Transcription factor 25 [Modicella reniformis]